VHRKPGSGRSFASSARTSVPWTELRDRGSGKLVRIPDGTAHFLEHKLFEQEEGDAFEIFSRRAHGKRRDFFRTTSYFFQCARTRGEPRTLLGSSGGRGSPSAR